MKIKFFMIFWRLSDIRQSRSRDQIGQGDCSIQIETPELRDMPESGSESASVKLE